MASSALNQLIAAQQGPNIAGSIMGGIQAAKQEQAQAQDAELKQQQISMAQKQLAGLDAKEAQAKRAESLKFAADIGNRIKTIQDPTQRAAIYEQGRQYASLAGADTSWWPKQYDEQTQIGLDNAVQHIYGEKQFETDEAIRKDQATPKTPDSYKEFELAKKDGGFSGTYKQFMDSKNQMTPYQQAQIDATNRRIDSMGQGSGADNYKVVGGRLVDLSSGKPVDVTPSGGISGKPLPVALQKLEGEDVEAIQTAGTIQADLGELQRQIDAGELDLGPAKNLWNRARNTVGESSPESRKFATLKASLERLRNDSLRLNKGVQTDGDAQRAWNELLDNINDPKLVSQRLGEIQAINERGAALRAQAVNTRRANNGVAPVEDFDQFKSEAAIGAGANKGAQQSPPLSIEDQAALDWANANPNDPRAAAIKQLHGGQ